MHSPPVQPISSSTSGTGSVSTMCEEVTDRRERSGGTPRVAAGPWRAPRRPRERCRTRPPRSTPPASARSASDGERSRTCAPRSISRRRRPSARRAGCRVAKSGISTPRRKRGESQRARTCVTRPAPPRARALQGPAAAATALRPTASKPGRGGDAHVAGLVEPGVHVLVPAPGSDVAHRIARGVQQGARRTVAEALPQRPALIQSDSQKPPLRPLGPWPHTAPSSSATLAPSSSRCHAVHMPVKPPPTTTTSACKRPSRAGWGSGSPASSSHHPVAV